MIRSGLLVTRTALAAPTPWHGIAGGMVALAVEDIAEGGMARRQAALEWLQDQTPGGGGFLAALLGATDLLDDVIAEAC